MNLQEKLSNYYLAGNTFREKVFYIVLVIAALAPIFMMPIDFWDGKIVGFAFRNNNFDGLRSWFFESRWVMQYYLYRGVDFISGGTGLDYKVVIRVIMLLSILGISAEVKYLAKYLFNIPERYVYLSRLLVVAYPAWHVLVSSVLVIHIICVWFILLGYRMTRERKYAGLIFIAISLQLNSNFALLVALIISGFISDRFIRGNNESSLLKPLSLSFLVLFLLFLIKWKFPVYGLYANYNAIKTDFNIKPLTLMIVRYFSFYMPLISVYILLAITGCLLSFKKIKDIFNISDLVSLSLILLIYLSVTLPYIAVGKYTSLYNFDGWTHRHMLLGIMPLSILIAYLHKKIVELKSGKGIISLFQGLAAVVTIIISITMLYAGYQVKADQAVFERSLINTLLGSVGAPPAGSVHISLNKQPPYRLRWYEANCIFEKAFGRASWIVEIDTRPLNGEFGSDYSLFFSTEEYRTMYICNDFEKKYHTDLAMELTGTASGGFSSWLNILKLSSHGFSFKVDRIIFYKYGARSAS